MFGPIELKNLVAEKLQQHEGYARALRHAVDTNRKLILNYHGGHDPDKFCVSILAAVDSTESVAEELVHVKGIGNYEEEGNPVTSMLAEVLKDFYGLDYLPERRLSGVPLDKE